MKHPTELKSGQSFEDLAEELGNLQYDELANFIYHLQRKIGKDGRKDCERGRQRLGDILIEAYDILDEVYGLIDEAWQICEPYMKEE